MYAPQPTDSQKQAAQQSNVNVSTPNAISSLEKVDLNLPATTPPPQPLSFFNVSPRQKVEFSSPIHGVVGHIHISPRNDSIETNMKKSHNTNSLNIPTDADCITSKSNINRSDKQTMKSSKSSQYQRLNSKEMLPPITSREEILYYPISAIQPSSPCCFSSTPRSQRRQRRPPSYLQLYVKCEWSEPFFQPDSNMDIITWYKNKDNHVTADRTLVVRDTTSLFELVQSILQSFGLLDLAYADPAIEDGKTLSSFSQLGCYNEVCFLSDVRISTCPETSSTTLTPLPIPGFYYKYVDRGFQRSSATNDCNSHTEKNESNVLSTDPSGLKRTLTAQVLDTPLFTANHNTRRPSQGRTRLALVFCTAKRQAYISSRTQRAVLPETIYHFQIVLEGMVDEDDLPSSFQTQVPVRCVSGTGGVQGGNMIDYPFEVNELNRKLWGDRDVIGLVSPSSNREKNYEKIIDVLSTPLFDPLGNQSLKEGVVERCLYQICSGHLSMRIAEKTQGTVDACASTTDWLARQVDTMAKNVSKKANSCLDEDLLCLGTEYDQKLEALVTKVML
jgi:hypothetical protein